MRLTKNREIKIGKKLKENRIANGYTQEKVAEILGCSPRYIGQLETDVTTGSISIIINLCNLYNITLDSIFNEYLNQKDNSSCSVSFSGYTNLNEDFKSIIDNNITFLNKLQNSKNK